MLISLGSFAWLFVVRLTFAVRSGHIDPKGDRVWEQKPGGTQEPESNRGLFWVQTKLFFRGGL